MAIAQKNFTQMHETICGTICIEKFLLIANFEFGKFSFLFNIVETWDVTNPSPLQKILSRDLREN
jgi:hypothetical protein